MLEQNKEIVRRFLEDGFNGRDLAVVDEVVASDFVNRNPPFPGLAPGPEGMKQVCGGFWAAFPDVRATIRHLIAEGDRVVLSVVLEGTHEGPLMAIPPSGNRIEITVIEIFRISGGKLRERWGVVDQLGLMQQIGALPDGSGAAPARRRVPAPP
jgi:predicted ester cyclase